MDNPKSTSELGSGARDVGIVFATKTWLILAGVINQGLLAWLLAPEGRGAYAVCMIFGTTIGTFFTLASERGAQYYVMNKEHTPSQGMAISLTFALLGSLLGVLVGYGLIQSDISYFQKAERLDFFLALTLIPLVLVHTALNMQLAGLRRFIELGLISVLRVSLNAFLFVLLILMMNLGVAGGLLTLVSSLSVSVTICLFVLKRRCGVKPEWPNLAKAMAVLAYGARFYAARIGNEMDHSLGVILLGLMATQAEIGVYAAALAMMVRMHVISQSIEMALYPRVTVAGESGALLAEQMARVSGLLTFAAVGLLVLFSRPIVMIILSPSFLPAVPLIQILAIGTIVFGYSRVLSLYLQATNRPGAVSWIVFATVTVNAVALILLYPILGVSGVAWAMTLAMFTRASLTFVFYKRATGRSLLNAYRPRWDDLLLIRSESFRLANRFVAMARRGRT